MVLNQVNALLDKHFPNDASRPSLLELEHSAAVAIHSGHPLLMDGLRPIAPNFVYTGMMVCQEKLKPMDDKLRAFIEGGKEQGVILVSFGYRGDGERVGRGSANQSYLVVSGPVLCSAARCPTRTCPSCCVCSVD